MLSGCSSDQVLLTTPSATLSESPSEPSDGPTQPQPSCVPGEIPTHEELPPAVTETGAAILGAAGASDYECLRTVLNPDVFLSDYGFGDREPDPVARWQESGSAPLETMGILLQMQFQVKETNEGTLYEWPKYSTQDDADALTSKDRQLFLRIMTEDEVDLLFIYEFGYVGPRLGILENGTWWFFIIKGI